MPTLHWFFSLGVLRDDARCATYRLTDSLQRRLAAYFPAPRSPNGAGRRLCEAHNATSGLIGARGLLGPAAPGWKIQLHMLCTEELLKRPLDVLRSDVAGRPDLVDPEPRKYLTKDRGPTQIDRLLGEMLSFEAMDGDAVYFEATGGFRPFQMAMTLGAELMLTHRPELVLAGTGYAEFGTEPDGANGNLSPVYDFTDLLMTPRWAAAAGALAGRLDARPLAALLRALPDEPKEASQIGALQEVLDLAWPEQLNDHTPLLRSGLGALGGSTQIDVLKKVLGSELLPLAEAAEAKRVLRCLLVAERLAAAGRFGDALRLAREAMVLRMIEALDGPDTQLESAAVRRAEKRLAGLGAGELKTVWRDASGLRNKASHGNLGSEQDRLTVEDVRRAFPSAEGAATGVLGRVRAAVEGEGWPTAQSPKAAGGVAWLAWGEHDLDEAARRGWAAGLLALDAAKATKDTELQPTRRSPKKSASLDAGPTWTFEPPSGKPSAKPPGTGWATGHLEGWGAWAELSHAVFVGDWSLRELMALKEALEEKWVLCWSARLGPWKGAAAEVEGLEPLFTMKTLGRLWG
jgi:hypothetical protein